MDSSDEKNWAKRYAWAKCREPYKTQLDTIGSQWIEGVLSKEELAFEVVQMFSELRAAQDPGRQTSIAQAEEVVSQINALAEAMLSASLRPDISPELRREALDFMRIEFGGGMTGRGKG